MCHLKPCLALPKQRQRPLLIALKNAQMVGLSVLMRLPALLSQAGTKIIVKDNGIQGQIYDFGLNGSLTTDITAMMEFYSLL